tara:strand:+ start:8522 stop:9415 length:894 start_codon:yes stop_codon:yes gene_type:complete
MAKKKTNKQVITGKNSDGKKVTIAVIMPSPEDGRESQKVYNRTFRDALESGALLRQKLDAYMEEQGLWDKEKQKEYDKIVNSLLEDEKKIKKGGIKLSEAKEIAMRMSDRRSDLRILISEKTTMDSNTAEGQADNTRFNYLMACCVVDNDTGKPIFVDEDGNPSLSEYEKDASEDYLVEAAGKLAEMLYGLDDDYESKLPENKFLKQYNFVNEDLKLIDSEGRPVDREGRLIDADGRFIDEDGNFVDRNGTRIDEDGEYLVEQEPFLDEDGKAVILEEKTKKKTPKKKTETKEASAS